MAINFSSLGNQIQNGNLLIVDGLNVAFRWKHSKQLEFKHDYVRTVESLAKSVQNLIGRDVQLIKAKTDDNRSYHISSKKIQKELGFSTKFTVEDAITDLKKAFENKLFFRPLDNENYFNVKKMQSIKLK